GGDRSKRVGDKAVAAAAGAAARAAAGAAARTTARTGTRAAARTGARTAARRIRPCNAAGAGYSVVRNAATAASRCGLALVIVEVEVAGLHVGDVGAGRAVAAATEESARCERGGKRLGCSGAVIERDDRATIGEVETAAVGLGLSLSAGDSAGTDAAA